MLIYYDGLSIYRTYIHSIKKSSKLFMIIKNSLDRNLNYKLIATPSPSGPLGNTGTAMDFRGGKPKKSTKFKITKKHNKKQYKKRTRKYLHNLK